MTEPAEQIKPWDVIKTYRYLRIGMIGAAVLLAASIVIEYFNADCWQTSISAYYYTPARAIFVGSMIVVGVSLIVYKGRTPYEDMFLNLAGMLAFVVAIAPTTDVGHCFSVPPETFPRNEDGTLRGWVVSNIDNNYKSLLIVGAISVVVGLIIVSVLDKDEPAREKRLSLRGLGIVGLSLFAGWMLFLFWDDFYSRAHGLAAFAMFGFLIAAIVANVVEQRSKRVERGTQRWSKRYLVIAVAMVLGGGLIIWLRWGGEHTIAVLETYEIVLFVAYWIAQTAENWPEEVEPSATSSMAPAPSGGA
jgi:hypothetical protein